ncbi:hypothetical protein FGO68_gene13395 [Halteria grandinella]|uniref:Uncharacterized protein n=1 Tax=Halteria grandinella TaxID=5974 RepID=A0A8J8NSG7_HALGN|nr:hypothetical protein FGO68_gene13395 [Halteria grandinella]
MIKKEPQPSKPKSVTIQLKTILKTPKCEFAPSSSKKILDAAQNLLKSLDTYRQNIDAVMVATYRSIKASRSKVKQLITLLERRVRYYMETSDENGVKNEDGDTKGMLQSIDAFNDKTAINLDRIKQKVDEELLAHNKAEDLMKEVRDRKVEIEKIESHQVVLEGASLEVKVDFKERIAWVVKALQVQDAWLMLVKLRKNDDNLTHAIVRLRQGCLEQLHTLKITDQTKSIFAVHQDRLIAGQSIFTYSNSTLTYLMIFGEPSMTDVIGLTDSYLLMGLKKYYTVNLWKWSKNQNCYVRLSKQKFSTNGDNYLEITNMQRLLFTQEKNQFLANVGHHNLQCMKFPNHQDVTDKSTRYKIHQKSKSKLLDFRQLPGSSKSNFILLLTDVKLILVKFETSQELWSRLIGVEFPKKALDRVRIIRPADFDATLMPVVLIFNGVKIWSLRVQMSKAENLNDKFVEVKDEKQNKELKEGRVVGFIEDKAILQVLTVKKESEKVNMTALEFL